MAMRNYRKEAAHALEMIGVTALGLGLFLVMVILFV